MYSLHALGSLTGDVDELVHLKVRLYHMEVLVEGGAIAPLRYYGDLGQGSPAHKQQDVSVPCFSEMNRSEQTVKISINVQFLLMLLPIP